MKHPKSFTASTFLYSSKGSVGDLWSSCWLAPFPEEVWLWSLSLSQGQRSTLKVATSCGGASSLRSAPPISPDLERHDNFRHEILHRCYVISSTFCFLPFPKCCSLRWSGWLLWQEGHTQADKGWRKKRNSMSQPRWRLVQHFIKISSLIGGIWWRGKLLISLDWIATLYCTRL